jgi:hypothetical protein
MRKSLRCISRAQVGEEKQQSKDSKAKTAKHLPQRTQRTQRTQRKKGAVIKNEVTAAVRGESISFPPAHPQRYILKTLQFLRVLCVLCGKMQFKAAV